MLRAITKAKITKAAKLVAGNVKVTPANVFFPQSERFTGTLKLDLTLRTAGNTTAFAYHLIKADKESFLRALEIILGMRKLYNCAYQVSIGSEILVAGGELDDTIDIFPTEGVSLVKVVK